MNLLVNIEIFNISMNILSYFIEFYNKIQIFLDYIINYTTVYGYRDESLLGSRDVIIEGPDPLFSDPYDLLSEDLKAQIRDKDYVKFGNEILSANSRFVSYFYIAQPANNNFSNWESLAKFNAEISANNNNKLLLLMDNLIILENTLENTLDTNLFYIKPLNKIELHELVFINFIDTIKLFIYEPVIFLENLILIFQKEFNSYFEYLQSLINFYGNYKNLTTIDANNFEKFYDTLSLNLFLNIQSQNHKIFLWLFENIKKDRLNKNVIIDIFENYNFLNKNNTYILFKKLYYLNKKHVRLNIFTYGFFYDNINIISNNIGFENDITQKAVYNNFTEDKLLFNNNNFVKTNIKLNKYFNKSLINKVYFKNTYKYNNLIILNKPNENFSTKIQKYLINLYFNLYVNNEDISKDNEKNQMYHYYLKKKHYTMYNRDRPFELFLPYKGHVHYGYEDNLSSYINNYWKENLLYSDTFFTRYMSYKNWDTIIFNYIFGNLVNDSTHFFKTFQASLNLDIYPEPSLTRSGLFFFFDYCKNIVSISKTETLKRTLNFFFTEELLTYEDLKLYYHKHFLWNVNSLHDEVTGIQYMPVRDYLNYYPWERLATSYKQQWFENYVEKLAAKPIKTLKQYYLIYRAYGNVVTRSLLYDPLIDIEKVNIDNIKLKNFGGYSQWWAWQQDAIMQKSKGFWKKNPTFTIFLKNINENIKKTYEGWGVWYPLRHNPNDLGTFYVDNMTKEAWVSYEICYLRPLYVKWGGIYFDMVTDYDERVILDAQKRGALGNTNVATLSASESIDFVENELKREIKVTKPTIRNKKPIVKEEDFVLEDATMAEIKEDRYKTSKGYSLDRKIADYKQKIARAILNKNRKPVKKLEKALPIPDELYIIKKRNTYLGTWPDSILQDRLEGIEPRVKYKKTEKVASIHHRSVMWGERMNKKWRKIWSSYNYHSTPWLVLDDIYSKHYNRQHGETYFNLNKKSWKMFLTGDDVFLLGDTLGILKQKEKNMPDRVDETYMAAEIYNSQSEYQLKKSSKHFNSGVTPYNLHFYTEDDKDYLREYKLTYLKGNFNWPKKMQWSKEPYLYQYTPNSWTFYLDYSPFFSVRNWITFYFTDLATKKEVLSADYVNVPMKEFWVNFRTDKKRMITKYIKVHQMEEPDFINNLVKKYNYVFNIILKDEENLNIDLNSDSLRKYVDISLTRVDSYDKSFKVLLDPSLMFKKEKPIMTKIEAFDYYKKFVKRLKNSVIESEKVKKWGEKNIISFFLPQYVQDSFIDTKNKLFINYIKKDIKMEWSSFYTNIEDLSGFSKLHIINKNFYTSYIDKKKITEEVLLRKVLTNNIKLPKTKHILLKKSYIISLIDFFQKDENLLKNYILYNIRKQQFIFLNEIINFYKVNIICQLKFFYENCVVLYELTQPKEYLKLLVLEQLEKVKEIKWFINFYSKYEDRLFEFLKNLFLFAIILIYCGVTSLLVVLIKNCLPNNIIYGIKTKEKLQDNGNIDLTLEQLLELENIMQIEIKEEEREKIFDEIYETLDEVNKKNIRMFFFRKNLKKLKLKLKLKKNFFDAEHKYIYMWEKRKDSLYMNSSNLQQSLKKVRVYNKFEDQKNKDLKENYITFYKTLIFEKNLEKLKDNTKVREDFWYKKKFYKFFIIVIRGLWFNYKDKKYNVSKLLFWNNDELFKQLNDEIKYVYVVPRPLEDIKVILIFLYKSAKAVLDYKFWIKKLYAYVINSEHIDINYRWIMEEAEDRVSFKRTRENRYDNLLINLHQYLKKILTTFKKIKERSFNKDWYIRTKKRENLLKDIITLSTKEFNLIKMRGTIQNIREIEKSINNEVPLFFQKKKLDKIDRYSENKLNDIKNKLKLELAASKSELILLKKLKEQELRVKYLDIAYANKFEFIKEDNEKWIKDSEEWIKDNEEWIKKFKIAKKENNVEYRNLQDLEKDSQDVDIEKMKYLEYVDINNIEPILFKRKKITEQKKSQMDNIEYQKYLRAYNFSYKFIDEDLDNEDIKFYESISDYNKELDEEYLKIEEQEKSKKTLEMEYEKKSNFFYGIYKKRKPYNRWWPTIGMRLNYVLAQLIGIFCGLQYNLQKIKKNNYTFSISILLNDIYVFIYRMYWEYLIIWKKKDTLKNLGKNIKDILKFSLILTPIIIYSIILYLVLLIFVLLCRIFIIFPKNSYQRFVIKKNKKPFIWDKKLKKIIFNLKKILIIVSILFKDLETGDTFLKQIYYKFYKLCAFFQYNLFYIKGAYILGYRKNNKIKDGVISIKNLLKLKYIVWIKKQHTSWYNSIWYYFWTHFWGLNKEKFSKIANYNEDKLEEMDLSKFDLILIWFDNDSYEIKKKIESFLNIKKNILKKIQNILNKSINYRNFEVFKNFYLGYKEINWKEENTVTDFSEKLEIIKQRKLNIKFNNILSFYNNLSIKDWITILNIHNQLNWKNVKELINLILIKVWDALKLPFTYFVYNKKRIYIENYITGQKKKSRLKTVQRFRDWKLKIHNIIIEAKISNMLKTQFYESYDFGDIFFIYKIDEVKWKKKNYYQEFFWKSCYWEYKKYREIIFTWLIEFVSEFEENYSSFEGNWTLREKFKYARTMFKFYNHAFSYDLQRKKSRDVFFYKQIDKKHKLERIYFIRGFWNWVTYSLCGEVLYSKIENIEKEIIEYKKYKDYKGKKRKFELKNIEHSLYVSNYIKEIPPQFWCLFIIYNKYYKYFLRYSFKDWEYPIKRESNSDYDFSRDYKWRLSAPDHNYQMTYFEISHISADLNTYNFEDFMASLSNVPYDPMIRWLVFILEHGLTREQFSENDLQMLNDENFVWGDISLTHLLTYNKKLDQYKYEIREFDRLVEGLDKMYVKHDSKDFDKEKFYREQFDLVSRTLLKENEGILKDLLNKRRLKNAKMLHKALAKNKLKTYEELQEENERENMKEFFYARKKLFFEQQLLEQFWEWQAEYESKIVEDKYFGGADIWNATSDAKSIEETYLLTGKIFGANITDYNYLLDNIVLKSYDQTIEEIHYFLVFKVWKILEKQLKVKHKKTQINYKHLDSNLGLLERINYDRDVVSVIEMRDKDGDRERLIHVNHFAKLEWQHERNESYYNFPENNILITYYQVGLSFTYEDKIKFNKEAERFQRHLKEFHGHEYLLELNKIIENRVKNLKNISKISLKYNKIKDGKNLTNKIVYINNIKWTWQQWLLYTDIDKENIKLDKTIVIFNERFNLWNLKRMPIRIKLPVLLDIDAQFANTYLANKSNYMSFLDHRHFLMTSTIGSYLKQSMDWEVCKKYLEKHFNKDIKDLILWVFTADALNREVLQIKKEYAYVLDNFARNYNIFHKLYFVGMSHYTWDLIKYHRIFASREDFPYDQYFKLKQLEFLNHDPGVKKIAARLEFLYLDKYSPVSYVYLFKNHFFFEKYFTRMYNLLSIASFFWIIKILFYTEVEYLSENFVLYIPIFAMFVFWYLRKRTKIIKDHYKGEELYLYRFKSSKPLTEIDREIAAIKWRKQGKAWLEHFYGSKVAELFMNNNDLVGGFSYEKFVTKVVDPEWWRYHTHKNKDNKIEAYQHIETWILFFIAYYLVEYWNLYQFEYRNSPWIWHYYKLSEITQAQMRLYTTRVPTSYKLREWIEDSYARLENGGNTISRFLENHYRQKKGLSIKPLDYGHDWQIITETIYPVFYDELEKPIFYNLGYGEMEWVRFSRVLSKFHRRGLNDLRGYTWIEIVAKDPREIQELYNKKATPRTSSKYDIHEKLVKLSIEFKEPLGYKPRIKTNIFVDRLQGEVESLLTVIRPYKRNNWQSYEHSYIDVKKEDRADMELLYQNIEALKDFKKTFKNNFKRWLFDRKYIEEGNPYRPWYEFQDFVMDKWNFDITDEEHLFTKFLFKMQDYADDIIEDEIKLVKKYSEIGFFDVTKSNKYDSSYLLHLYVRICNRITDQINNFRFQTHWQKDNLFKMRKKYLKTNIENIENIDMGLLLTITETEKHYHNLCYNLLKYKLNRIETITQIINKRHLKKIIINEIHLHKKQSLLNSYKETNFLIRWWYSEQQYKRAESILEQDIEKTKEAILKHQLKKQNYDYDLNKFKIFFKKYENYVHQITKKINEEDVVEYKCNLILKYFNIKQNFWVFMADFTEKLYIGDFVWIIIKTIIKILISFF